MYKTCSICKRVRYHSRFVSNGRDKSHRKSYCNDCRYFKKFGSKDIFNTKKLRKSNIKVTVKIRSKKRVFYNVTYEQAINMVKEKRAGIVNDTCIHQFDLRDVVLKKYKHICQYCGVKGNTIDHIVPRSKGGKTAFNNLVCACEQCNTEKGDLGLDCFLSIKKSK
ncbi:hypothetical protein CN635_25300 [Priestia aryabhattai]|nr:hypothetical protein CN635_25300 [Priestia aryabhattai]